MTDTIEFSASVKQVKTLADHGLDVTFSMPEESIAQAAQLMACKREGIYLKVICSADIDKQTGNNAISEGAIRKSERATT